ncbi:MAG: SIS domain-containing protein [Stellaceae bacterium]
MSRSPAGLAAVDNAAGADIFRRLMRRRARLIGLWGQGVDPIIDYLARSRDVIQRAIDDPVFVAAIAAAADLATAALQRGNKLLLAGNGGSAGDAQHIAGEIVGRFAYDRPAAAALALTTDSSILTAIANDYGYDEVFARQVRGLGRRGDVLIALSTSGRSANILRAIAAAREQELAVVGLTGASGGAMRAVCDVCLCVPSDSTPLVQQVHLTAGHILCALVEERLFPRHG